MTEHTWSWSGDGGGVRTGSDRLRRGLKSWNGSVNSEQTVSRQTVNNSASSEQLPGKREGAGGVEVA
jgi:hypothetical protein